MHLEIRYWNIKWYEIPRMFALVFDPEVGPAFLMLVLQKVEPGWAIPKVKYAISNRLQKSLSQRLAPAFHKKYREGLSDKNMAVYKKPLPEKYDPIKELKVCHCQLCCTWSLLTRLAAQEFWTKHNLSQYRTDWLKIAKSKNLFTFWRGTVSDGLFDWAIDNYFIKGHTNNHIEGMFNYVDEYTKVRRVRTSAMVIWDGTGPRCSWWYCRSTPVVHHTSSTLAAVWPAMCTTDRHRWTTRGWSMPCNMCEAGW